MKIDAKKIEQAKEFAKKLIEKMSLTEKVGQLSQFGNSIYGGVESFFEDHYPEGKVGSYLSIHGVKKLNGVQKRLMEETPNHIPALFAYDVIHGFKTTFPTPLTQSFSWDPWYVAKESARVAAKEAYAAGIRWTFAPMVDISRDPRWGRIMEGYGEDTYLTSEFSAATVEGFQGDEIGAEDTLLACAKHFVTYGACIGGRDYNSVDMSLQTLLDVYVPPFKAAFEAGCLTCMPAFNDFNGVPCTCNTYLLQDVLRKELGFKGVTISDAGAIAELVPHNVCANIKEAVELAFNAGIDIIMAFDPYNDNIPALVEEGKIDIKDVDAAVERVLVLKYLAGIFEKPFVDEKKQECFFSPEHRHVSREVAKRCPVLLKNDNSILPIDENKKILLVGPIGNDPKAILGGWAGPCEPAQTITVLAGLENCFGKENVAFSIGCSIEGSEEDKENIEKAVEAVSEADIVVFAVGEHSGMAGEANSRSDISLPGLQEKLIEAVAEASKQKGVPCVAMIFSGRPLTIFSWRDKVDAILFAGQLGTEGGNAIADILSGDYNPSGRLSCSLPCSEGQIPCYYNSLNTGRPALGKWVFESKYRDLQIEPAYAFGYGLSYTTFEYTELKLSKDKMSQDPDDYILVSVDVQNTGDRAGEEVVQLYIRDMIGSRARPMKELKGFDKIMLAPGEKKTVEFTLKNSGLAFTDWNMKKVTEPGDFSVMISKNAAEPVLFASFKVE